MKILPGSFFPLGATWDGEGVNFALYSENATAVELCLFDEANTERRISLPSYSNYIWHGYLLGIRPGQRYGYRVHGPYEPARGLRFNPNVLLLDPYAKAVDSTENWQAGCFSYELGNPDGDLRMTEQPQMGAPRAVVIDPEFDWEDDKPPQVPLHRSVIYEAHVRGLTIKHPEVPENIRGTYAGIAHPVIIRYLKSLGITAIELMPIHGFVDDKLLLDKGLRNYWGYNSVSFFAPDVRYRSSHEVGSEVREFKEMVKALHRAGIEVILDVVYNHTAEGNHLGPTFHFKGIDNPTYYRLVPEDPRYYFDYTGTGNTLNVRHPQVLALIMDSLRYWESEMHIDGFRFDLASSLARQLHEVDQLSSFFTLIHQAPNLSQLKLLAEPWDVGEGGYQVGNFPVRWAEWNGRYRDAVRSLWRGDGGLANEIGFRLTGSSDLYQSSGRQPSASINFVTAHDGFTVRDLVTYSERHNEANGENNQDGHQNEGSWNCGVEGPTEDEAINALRRRQQRNLLATLLFSQGTPMLVAGDEYGRTQCGNNNAYCQDNEISWFDWSWTKEQSALFEFTKRLLRIRRDHPALQRSKFFQGDGNDLQWFRLDGSPMTAQDWENPFTKSLVMFVGGRGINDVDKAGRPVVDDNLLLILNASETELPFVIPQVESVRESWQLLVDTSNDEAEERRQGGENTTLIARSLKFFRAPSRVVRAGGAFHTLGATYRLQLNKGFGFAQAREVVDYIADLGATDIYSSPLLQATRGSSHGYDVVDHSRLNSELGTEEEFIAWNDKRKERGLGFLLDWVPNHMGIASGQNRWWDDVLENGPSSLYAEFFDIDWSPLKESLQDRVLLPVLGAPYGEILERGELQLIWEVDSFKLCYYERRFPLSPASFITILEATLRKMSLPEESPARQELESIISALTHLPSQHETAPERRKERARENAVIKRRLSQLVQQEADLKGAIEEVVRDINGSPGVSASFDALDQILRQQSYRLASWHVAAEEINYRRFFDVNDLAALRMESSLVFEQAHSLLFTLLSEHRVDGLRLDHTDGLYDPYAYFEALQHKFHPQVTNSDQSMSPDDIARPLPLLVEKILEPGEQLTTSWPVDGTTGYEFANSVLGLWIDPKAESPLTRLYERFTGDAFSFAEHVYESKQHILRFSLASEINMLGRALERIASKNRSWSDFTLTSLTRALTETLAHFPVYRTYLRETGERNEQDESHIKHAIQMARRSNAGLSATIFTFLESLLLLKTEGTPEERKSHVEFALRFQQLTGPIMAKSVEDTAFYRYNRFICLNEVGGSPSKFGTSVEEFHQQNTERARTWPLTMIATSTHDTKRGEDTSARLAVLSEMTSDWKWATRTFSSITERVCAWVDGERVPSRQHEYLFYQALIGAWPFGWDTKERREEFIQRMGDFLYKAAKEGKQQTSWTNPNPAYDEALPLFVKKMLQSEELLGAAKSLCDKIAPFGAQNSLSQCVLRFCSPGIPDTYQGSELWNQSLVDPDNRRPVDYTTRRQALAQLREKSKEQGALCAELLAHFTDGKIKLYVTHVLLQLRRAKKDLFLRGDYEALAASEHLVAFTRGLGEDRLICCVPRLPYTKTQGLTSWALGDVWGEERLRVPFAGKYRNVFTGAVLHVTSEVRLSEVFAEFPVAALVKDIEAS